MRAKARINTDFCRSVWTAYFSTGQILEGEKSFRAAASLSVVAVEKK